MINVIILILIAINSDFQNIDPNDEIQNIDPDNEIQNKERNTASWVASNFNEVNF